MSARSIGIKNYINTLFASDDEVLTTIKNNAKRGGLPEIEVPSTVGKLLYMFAKIHNPQRVLEIGTLAGYSTVWLARALSENAQIISLEIDAHHVVMARNHFKLANLEKVIEIKNGDARLLLNKMIENEEPPFDLIFIDADKGNYAFYLDKALQLSRPGTLILCDNLIPKGEQIGTAENGEAGLVYQFNHYLASHPQLETILATTIVGDKGRLDALGISLVK